MPNDVDEADQVYAARNWNSKVHSPSAQPVSSICPRASSRSSLGDRLIFLTDGVVEAMNSANELFGFDRIPTISNLPAAAIAQQAQAFGQNDGITALSIEFAGAPSEATDEAFAAF
jgi:serine/threonine protein phosphatase PrpC